MRHARPLLGELTHCEQKRCETRLSYLFKNFFRSDRNRDSIRQLSTQGGRKRTFSAGEELTIEAIRKIFPWTNRASIGRPLACTSRIKLACAEALKAARRCTELATQKNLNVAIVPEILLRSLFGPRRISVVSDSLSPVCN